MNRKVRISRAANADIAGIWDYTAQEYGPERADQYVSAFDRVMAMALQFPEIGSDFSDIRKGYRKLTSGEHLIFYIAHADGIEVMRVLHSRADVSARLGE